MQNCLIVVNTAKNDAPELGEKISGFLKTHAWTAEIYRFPHQTLGKPPDSLPFAGRDLVVTLGGDGTVLFAARGCAPLGIPVFPVNLGNFGFIANVQKCEWERRLADFLDGSLTVEPRTMVEVSIDEDGAGGEKICTSNALNDIVLAAAENTAKIITLDIACKGVPLGRFKADAVAVSTPTGSTAYSAAAGGPIIDPALDALVLTPVCPFSLSSRPLVLSPESELEITVPLGGPVVRVLADGQTVCDAGEAARIRVKKSEYAVKLVGGSAARFYEALKTKMNWSGGPRA
jgi:NAD+ kinase